MVARRADVQDLYGNLTEDLRVARRQQIAVAGYALLLYTGIVGYHELMLSYGLASLEFLKTLVTLVAAVVFMFAVLHLLSYELWIARSRDGLRSLQGGPAGDGTAESGPTGSGPVFPAILLTHAIGLAATLAAIWLV